MGADLVVANTAEILAEVGFFLQEVEGSTGVEGGSSGNMLGIGVVDELIIEGELVGGGQRGLSVLEFVFDQETVVFLFV